MLDLFTQLIEATTQREIDLIVEKNIFSIPGNLRAKLCQFANRSKRRIYLIDREKKKSFGELLN